MSRFKLSRRAFLRGVIGGGALVSVGLPTLEAMLDDHGESLAGGGALPGKFVLFFFGNGVLPGEWIPSQTGSGYTLSPLLASLSNVRDQLTVVSGHENKITPRITHHEGVVGSCSGHPFISSGGLYSRFGGFSIDQVVADAIGAGSLFPSIQVAVSKRVSDGTVTFDEGPTMSFISHRSTPQAGGNLPLPPEQSPRALWSAMFNNFDPPETRTLRSSVLDAVRDDVNRLKDKVSMADRQRLDAHLDGVNQLQTQIEALPPICDLPTEPTEENIDQAGVEPMLAVSQAMSDLIVYAFDCDITRVASYMLTPGVGYHTYSHLGHNKSQHNLSHDAVGGSAGDTDWDQYFEAIEWNVQQFAYLCDQLKLRPDGQGTLLDSSALILGSDCGVGWAHNPDDHPCLIAGGGNGRLAPGTHVRGNDDNLSNALLTAMKAAAPAITEVGSSGGYSNTPIAELLL